MPSYLSFTAGEGYKLTGNGGLVGLFMDLTDSTIPFESIAATLNVVSAADSYQSYAFYFGADAAPAGGNSTSGATKGLVIELQPGGTQEWGVYDIANSISYTANGSTVGFSGSAGTRQNGSTLMGGEFPKTGDLSARIVYDEGHLIIYVNGERKLDLYLSDLPDLTGDKFGVSVETFQNIVCQVEGFAIEKPSADDIDPHTHAMSGGGGTAPASWAAAGNTDLIPATKLPIATVNQGDAGVATDVIMTPATSASLADARIAAAGIGDLSDVDTATTPPALNDVLGWDGTKWKPAAAGGGGSNPGYLHLGAANIEPTINDTSGEVTSQTGVVSGQTTRAVSRTLLADINGIRFDDNATTYPSTSIPTGGAYDNTNGQITLPAGNWIVCASAIVRSRSGSGGGTDRLWVKLGIMQGNNLRHENSDYIRYGDQTAPYRDNQLGNTELTAAFTNRASLSTTGSVVADGTTKTTIRLRALAANTTAGVVEILAVHVHAFKV